MKRVLCFLLLLPILAVLVTTSIAQTRPRRVPNTSTQTPPPPTTQSGPPVLRGNNRHPNEPVASKPMPQPSQEPEEVDPGDVIRVDTNLVTIPLSVTDRDGRYIPNLTKNNFRLWEDGIEQDIAYFSSVDKPFSVVLVIDTSNSTRFRLEDIQDAAITFVNQLRADDRVMVVSFDDRIRVLTEFTSNRMRMRDAILDTETGDGTRLYDAIDMIINQRLNNVSGRKAIVLFTDGVDTTSRHASYDGNLRDAEELDALIYPIQYDTFADMNRGGGMGWPGSRNPTAADILAQILSGMGGRRGGGRFPGSRPLPGTSREDYEVANRYLHEIAQRTGARPYEADTTQNLTAAFSNIAEELRRQYSLGFYPKRAAQAGERRQIRVRVNQPNLAVRARDSYIFNPTAASGRDDTASRQSTPVLRKKL